ncbi:hypothetical protein AB1Y20_000852 [Prymnesium parvum]|uniref:Sulfotransferase domain-containing protein n=1 Tax=Prymnesium parvum TaxID=97485 RepID=A0AB34K7V5_PRYPA
MALPPPRVLLASTDAAARADAGDCFRLRAHELACLPHVINIGVQKAGTGELQTWLGAHPRLLPHGGEVHFFDTLRREPPCGRPRGRAALRLRYARFLWRRRRLTAAEASGKLLYEKTPAYFDQARPEVVMCAVPSARLLLMLRMPTARAVSAYRMCQRELQLKWCRSSFDAALARVLTLSGNRSVPSLRKAALRREPHFRRLLMMGQYALHLRRWLRVVPPRRVGVVWLEQFKYDPFACLAAVEDFLGLEHHAYREMATKNSAGLWVIGKSKSSVIRPPESRPSASSIAALEAFYSPWQRRLKELLLNYNLSLVHTPAPPLALNT